MSILRTKPAFTYNGITLVLSNPSRFDIRNENLLTASGEDLVNEFCLQPEFNTFQCDIRVKECGEPLLPNTRVIMTLGESATHLWLPQTRENSIGEVRGSVFISQKTGIPTIPSFFPQDAADPRDLEGEFNDLQSDETESQSAETEDNDNPKRRHGKTRRNNFAFWMQQDFKKAKWLAKGNPIPKSPDVNYNIYPEITKVIDLLTNSKNKNLFIDIETDAFLNITCIGLSFGLPEIYVVPIILWDYTPAYDMLLLARLFRALAVSFRDNQTVAHNGSGFDFFVFGYKLSLPVGARLYDTMLAHHRCFPQVEKSLGHCMSMWTWQPFHKDEGSFGYRNQQQAKQLWQYCGKDIYGLILIFESINAYAARVPGLVNSIQQANDSIRPYLICQLQGIKYDEQLVKEMLVENDRLMMQYLRIIEYLVGKDNLKEIRGKGKSSLPSSNKQCVKYFHDLLGYEVVARGKPDETGKRNSSLAKGAMFKLRLKYENPVIDLILAYRRVQKETSTLKFNPWSLHNNDNINTVTERIDTVAST